MSPTALDSYIPGSSPEAYSGAEYVVPKQRAAEDEAFVVQRTPEYAEPVATHHPELQVQAETNQAANLALPAEQHAAEFFAPATTVAEAAQDTPEATRHLDDREATTEIVNSTGSIMAVRTRAMYDLAA